MPLVIPDTVTICSLALAHIGQADSITDFDNDQSVAGDKCRLFFPFVIDETFRAFQWSFATTFASPALVAGPSPTATLEWACSYRYPSDAVWVRRIIPAGLPITLNPAGYPFVPNYPSTRVETSFTRVPFRIVADTEGLLILTDFPPVAAVYDSTGLIQMVPQLPVIEYIFQQDGEQLYPSDFAQACAFLLAFYLAPSLTKGDKYKLGARAYTGFQLAISRAQANSKNESQADLPAEASWIDARN